MVSVGWVTAVLLSGNAVAQGIYTCVDGKGRKITADRQIAECSDRVQQEISPSGTVRRVLGPALTERERAAQDDKDRVEAAVRAREQEDKRRSRALLLRYPNQTSHDKERELALLQVDELLRTAVTRMHELQSQRLGINADFEFYEKDPKKAPTMLVRRRDENDSNVAGQKRFMAEQTLEKQRVNARFDAELVQLKQLWAMANVPLTVAPAITPRVSAKN